jgi:hypothetical protein
VVSIITYVVGPSVASNNIDAIAKSIDGNAADISFTTVNSEIHVGSNDTDASAVSYDTKEVDTAIVDKSSSVRSTSTAGNRTSWIQPTLTYEEKLFDPGVLVLRLFGAVATLGSGCSLGPEGPAVELGAGLSRVLCSENATARQKHHLFLAGKIVLTFTRCLCG